MFKLHTPLARMKAVASGLLLMAAALYVTALELAHAQPVFAGYLKAFSEAAMVGAIADWFAVTALFRRPLGLPIPHTPPPFPTSPCAWRVTASVLCATSASASLCVALPSHAWNKSTWRASAASYLKY